MNNKMNKQAAIRFIQNWDSKTAEMRKISSTLKDPKEYQKVFQRIKEYVREASCETIQVLPYGSRIMGIGTSSSDLDIYVEVDGIRSEELFKFLVRSLRDSGEWRVTNVVEKTQVPVISAVALFNNLNCKHTNWNSRLAIWYFWLHLRVGDITTKNGLGVANSEILAHLFDIQPHAASLYLSVRAWIRSQGLADLKGYTICLLVLYFLQRVDMMPTIEVVQEGLSHRMIDSK